MSDSKIMSANNDGMTPNWKSTTTYIDYLSAEIRSEFIERIKKLKAENAVMREALDECQKKLSEYENKQTKDSYVWKFLEKE